MQEELYKEFWNRDQRANNVIREQSKPKGQKIPDPKKHQIVSFIKSGIRILGYGFLWYSLDIAATLLILSEVVGIGEELV